MKKKSIKYFIQEYNKHPEWKKKSIAELSRDKQTGGSAFYKSLYKYAKKKSNGDKVVQSEIISSILKRRIRSWVKYKTTEDFIQEYNKHPEWKGKPFNALSNKKNTYDSAFTKAFYKYAKRESKGDRRKYREIIDKIFISPYRDWSNLKTVGDWKREFDGNKDWRGKSTDELRKSLGGVAFYSSFNNYANKISKGDKEKRRKITEQLFGKRLNYWHHLKLNDFINIFNNHPEWHGRTTSEMRNDLKLNGASFYDGFLTWAKKYVSNEIKRKTIMHSIFPERKAIYKYNFNGEIAYFDSQPERIIGLLLYKYCHIKYLKEGQNLHVQTSNIRHKLDFLIGNNFIEFHPLNIREIKRNFSLKEARKRKEEGIQYAKFKLYNFFFIYKIDQLFDVIKNKKFKINIKKEYQSITRDQFNQHVLESYKRTVEFDEKNPIKHEPKFGRWITFNTIQDFELEFSKHPDWHNLSTTGIEKNPEFSKFYRAVLGFSKKKSLGDKKKQKRIMEYIFRK